MFNLHLECEIALCLAHSPDAEKIEKLIALFVSGPVRAISDVQHTDWTFPGAEKSILIVDFELFQHQSLLQQVDWQESLRECKLIVLDTPADEDTCLLLLRAGVAGIFPPQVPYEVLLKGLTKILGGERWFPRAVLNRFVVEHQRQAQTNGEQDSAPVSLHSLEQLSLSRREREVLELLCQGASNDEISERLYISIHTVKSHVSHILRKTHTHSRLDVVHWAITQGLVTQRGAEKAT